MDPLTLILQTYGIWAFLGYVVIKDVLPKLFPSVAKAIDKRVSVEDRLFTVIERSNECFIEVARALEGLRNALEGLDQRVYHIENLVIKDSIDKLIVPSHKI